MGSLIEGRFAYAMANKPNSVGHKKTGSCVGENRKLDARFFVKGIREFAESTTSSPSVQLQSIRLRLAVIAYRKWNFRAMDVSRAFLTAEPLGRDTYVKLPQGVDEDNVDWKLLKPMYGLSAACKDWYKTIRNFLAIECGD